MTQIKAKKAAAKRAAELIENGQIVGLGSGSTADFFIEELSLRVKQGLKIQAVSSSKHSETLAKQKQIPTLDLNNASHIDVTIDGADQVDPQKRLIKGAGGAHVREKILASASDEMIVIVDETKIVPALGKTKLPVEIIPFGSIFTIMHIEECGFQGKLRMLPNEKPFVTDNGNYLFDIDLPIFLLSPEKEHEKLISIPGVIDTGFFFHLAKRVIVGYFDGSIREI